MITPAPKEVIEAAGFEYLGEQKMPKGRPSAFMFNLPSGSTLMMEGPVTVETLTAKLEARRLSEETFAQTREGL